RGWGREGRACPRPRGCRSPPPACSARRAPSRGAGPRGLVAAAALEAPVARAPRRGEPRIEQEAGGIQRIAGQEDAAMQPLSAALVAAAIVLGGSTLRAADELGVKKVLSLNAAMKIAAAA